MRQAKRVYQKKLYTALLHHGDFLMEAAGREWERMERTAKSEERIRQVKAAASIAGKTLLVLLLFAGTVTVAAVAPNIFAAVGRLSRRKGFYDTREFRKAAAYLKGKKFITAAREKDRMTVELTSKGRTRALKISYKDLQLSKDGKWDGKWRIVFSDIPNKHKWARECFRSKLKEMGFYRLQKSVYVTPHPCSEEIRFLESVFNLPDGSVQIVETGSLDDEKSLREYFSI